MSKVGFYLSDIQDMGIKISRPLAYWIEIDLDKNEMIFYNKEYEPCDIYPFLKLETVIGDLLLMLGVNLSSERFSIGYSAEIQEYDEYKDVLEFIKREMRDRKLRILLNGN